MATQAQQQKIPSRTCPQHTRGQNDLRLLLSVRADEGVDLGGLDVVQALHCQLDHGLVGALVDDEDERVVVLNLLHRALGRQRVHDDRVAGQELACGLINARADATGVPVVLGLPLADLRLWPG